MCTVSGQVVIVTGSVGNLGMAAARAFRAAGARTVLVDRSPDRLAATYPDLADSRDHFLASGVDLSLPESVDRMVASALERFRRIDVLVNTVGGFRGGSPVHREDPATLDAMLGTNLRTAYNTCRAVIPTMLEQRSGRIINTASRNALVGSAKYAAYSISKTAVLRLTESLSAELKGLGINVNCILPGTLDTPQNRQSNPQADGSSWVSVDDLAAVYVFLASDEARAIHGAAIPVYGTG